MLTQDWNEFIYDEPDTSRLISATIGVFDGVHLGHVALLSRIIAHSNTKIIPTVFTFRDNPKTSLGRSIITSDIFSLEQKLYSFSQLGIGLVVIIDFSGEFGKLSGKDFIGLLKNRGKLRYLAVGSDFRCGFGLDTNAADIQCMNELDGIPTEIVAPVIWGGHPVSSSRIRAAILSGNLVEATALLGRNVELDLSMTPSTPGNAWIDFDVSSLRRITPPPGRYPVMISSDDSCQKIRGQADLRTGVIRVSPTFRVSSVEFLLR